MLLHRLLILSMQIHLNTSHRLWSEEGSIGVYILNGKTSLSAPWSVKRTLSNQSSNYFINANATFLSMVLLVGLLGVNPCTLCVPTLRLSYLQAWPTASSLFLSGSACHRSSLPLSTPLVWKITNYTWNICQNSFNWAEYWSLYWTNINRYKIE